MALLEKCPARNKYKCDGCGKVDFWNDSWGRYSSIALDEACPNDVPAACSDECFKIVEEKIKSGEFKLPVLRMHPSGFCVSREREGY